MRCKKNYPEKEDSDIVIIILKSQQRNSAEKDMPNLKKTS